jgi:hypothetical protein
VQGVQGFVFQFSVGASGSTVLWNLPSITLGLLGGTVRATCSASLLSASSFIVGPVGTPTVGTAAYRLIVPPCFRLSLVSANLWQRKGELWARNGRLNLAYNCNFHGNCKDYLHAAKLRHGTVGFTSPSKEGTLRIFLPEKSGGFGRVWTRERGYHRPLDRRSRSPPLS